MLRKVTLSVSFLGIAAASAAALLLSATHAGAEGERPADSTGPNADTKAPEPPRPPPFDKVPFSDERTSVPTAAEWKTAEQVTLDPMDRGPTGCSAKRVREWVQLHCTGTTVGGVRMLGGKKDGLQVRFDSFDPDMGSFFSEGVQVYFPVRRGDQRVIEVMQVEFGYRSASGVSPWFVISELWPEGEDSPEIAVR
jgi:hypothetical protein